jgi:hypothetical protein
VGGNSANRLGSEICWKSDRIIPCCLLTHSYIWVTAELSFAEGANAAWEDSRRTGSKCILHQGFDIGLVHRV